MTSVRTIHVTLTWDDSAKEWIATTTSGPALSTRAALYEDVITYLRRAIRQKLDTKDFVLEEKLELPARAKELLRQTEHAVEQLAHWKEEVPRLRIKFANMLTSEFNLHYHQAAALQGLSPSYLSKIKESVSQKVTQETTTQHKETRSRAKR